MNCEREKVRLALGNIINHIPPVTAKLNVHFEVFNITTNTVQLYFAAAAHLFDYDHDTINAADDTRRARDHIERVAVVTFTSMMYNKYCNFHLIKGHRRRCPNLELLELWHRLRKKGYTRCITSLYRVMKKHGMLPQKAEKKKRVLKPYEQMTYAGERVQIDVKVVPRKCIADPKQKLYQYTAIDEYHACALYTAMRNKAHILQQISQNEL